MKRLITTLLCILLFSVLSAFAAPVYEFKNGEMKIRGNLSLYEDRTTEESNFEIRDGSITKCYQANIDEANIDNLNATKGTFTDALTVGSYTTPITTIAVNAVQNESIVSVSASKILAGDRDNMGSATASSFYVDRFVGKIHPKDNYCECGEFNLYKFCTKCGKEQSKYYIRIHCIKCDVRLSIGDSFCGSCGSTEFKAVKCKKYGG